MNVISASLRDELEQDSIRITNVMPGAIATNFARNFDVEFSATMLKMAGIDADPHLADIWPETLEALANNMQNYWVTSGCGQRGYVCGDPANSR